jgi:hypothetical protein
MCPAFISNELRTKQRHRTRLMGQVVPSLSATSHRQVIVNTRLNDILIGLVIAH